MESTIIVREYLESLTESDELDVIFPILLEVMGFRIVTTPKSTKGIAQYGKDIVAIGKDRTDGVVKKFFFEVKGGSARNINYSNLNKKNGIIHSIRQTKFKAYKDSSIPNFNNLPTKIVLVHNGDINPNAKETFDGFIEDEFPDQFRIKKVSKKTNSKKAEFERWDIFELTKLFNKFLFSEYLLTNSSHVNQFKKVIVFLNNPQNDFTDFYLLVDRLIIGLEREKNKRKQKLILESLKLVAFIVFSYARDAKNLEPAKKSLPYLILKVWGWIIEGGKIKQQYVGQFDKIYKLYLLLLSEYFDKLIPIARLQDGLSSVQGGRYEQIGYPVRSLEFASYLVFYFECINTGLIHNSKLDKKNQKKIFLEIVKYNACSRPLLDNHSVPIFMIYNELIKLDKKSAEVYLRDVINNIQIAYKTMNRLPDGNNNLANIIQFVLTGKKSVYYMTETSLLFGMLIELLAICGLKKEYIEFSKFITEIKIDLGVYVPFDDSNIKTYMPKISSSLEERFFKSGIPNDGYQSSIFLDEIDAFKIKTLSKMEFNYDYQTNTTAYSSLISLAHIFYKTPFFPSSWRNEKIKLS